MTLLELLRQELPKRGGWPVGAKFAWVDPDCEIRFSNTLGDFFTKNKIDNDQIGKHIGDGRIKVTREQYETTGWDGTGLPPVGCEFEYGSHRTKAKCLAVAHHMVFASKGNPDDEESDYEEFMISILDSEFHRVRTEAERAIDEMVQLSGVSTGAAKILYDAGYRK